VRTLQALRELLGFGVVCVAISVITALVLTTGALYRAYRRASR
jgi:hypothetical protein